MWDASLLLTLKLQYVSYLYPRAMLGAAQHYTRLLHALLARERQQHYADGKGAAAVPGEDLITVTDTLSPLGSPASQFRCCLG